MNTFSVNEKTPPGRKKKLLPNKNHPAILEFLQIMYSKQVNTWNDIVSTYISRPDLIKNKSLENFSDAGVLETFKRLFRIHETQKLRNGVTCEQDLIVLLRSVAKKYEYYLESFYANKKPTKYCIKAKKV